MVSDSDIYRTNQRDRLVTFANFIKILLKKRNLCEKRESSDLDILLNLNLLCHY